MKKYSFIGIEKAKVVGRWFETSKLYFLKTILLNNSCLHNGP